MILDLWILREHLQGSAYVPLVITQTMYYTLAVYVEDYIPDYEDVSNCVMILPE